jgi:hypothetical protein
MPAPSFRSFTKANGTTANPTVNKPAGVVAGDLLVLYLVEYHDNGLAAPILTWPTGFTARGGTSWTELSFSDGVMAVQTKVADGTEGSTLVITRSGNPTFSWKLYCAAFQNAAAHVGTTQVVSDYMSSTTSLVIPSITMPTAGGLIVALVEGGGSSPSLPAGMTNIDADTEWRFAYEVRGAGATGTRTTTLSPAAGSVAAVMLGAETVPVSLAATANGLSGASGALTVSARPPGGLSFNDGFYGPAPVAFYGAFEQPIVTFATAANGSSTATGSVVVSHPLAATAAGTSTATAGLVVAHPLAATANGRATATGGLNVSHPLAATANGRATATGGLIVAHPLAATANGVSTAVATIARDRGFSATANGTFQGARYTAEVLADGPVGYWKLNELAGSTAFDSSGSGLNGTYVGTPTRGAAGALVADTDPALTFDGGGTQHINLGTPAALQITGNQTIELWLRPTAFNARRNPWNKAYAGEGTITQEVDGSLNYFYGINGTDGATYQGFTMSGTLTLNVWQQVVLVRDLTAMKLRWYVNGVLRNETDASYAAAVAGTQPALIGDGYVDGYLGGIDEVAVYNKALTAADIERHYLAGQDGLPNWFVARTISATAYGTSTATATGPNVAHPLAATANGASTATADIAILRAYEGPSLGQSTATGELIVHHTLGGTADGRSTLSGPRYGPTEPPDYGVTDYGVMPYGGDLDDAWVATAFGKSTASADVSLFFAVKPDSIPSEEAVGVPHAMLLIKPAGIASPEVVPAPVVRAFNYIQPEGIPSEEAFGEPSAAQRISPSGIPSEEAVGTPRTAQIVYVDSITSEEAFGTSIRTHLYITNPRQTVEGAAGGAHSFVSGFYGQSPVSFYGVLEGAIPVEYGMGISSEEAVGVPGAANFSIFPQGIASEEAFGSFTTRIFIRPIAVSSAESVSAPEVLGGLKFLLVIPSSIASAENVPAPRIRMYVGATSVPTSEAVGTPKIVQGVRPASIPSGEAVGTPAIQLRSQIRPGGIPSAEVVSSPTVIEFELPAGLVVPLAIPSAEAVGTPTLEQVVPAQQILPSSVPPEEAFGTVSFVVQEDWWSTKFLYRRRVEVLASSTEALPVGHGVDFEIPAFTIEQGKLRRDLGDLELIYPVDNGWVRLPRQASVVGDVIEVRFLLAGDLQPAATGEYYLYYGSPLSTGAGRPVFVDNPWPILVGASDERIDYTRPTEHWDYGVASHPGARAAFEFAGTSVRLLSDVGPAWGLAEVQLDQGPWQKVELYREEAEAAVEVFAAAGLDPEDHKIRVRMTGQKDPQASTNRVNVAGFEYVAPYQVTVHGEEVDLSSWSVMTVVGD